MESEIDFESLDDQNFLISFFGSGPITIATWVHPKLKPVGLVCLF